MDDDRPETQPSGALTPPPVHPPTAIATSAPLPPRRPSVERSLLRRTGLRGLMDSALDSLDALADRIAGIAGIR